MNKACVNYLFSSTIRQLSLIKKYLIDEENYKNRTSGIFELSMSTDFNCLDVLKIYPNLTWIKKCLHGYTILSTDI
jgi:hypothetical protein